MLKIIRPEKILVVGGGGREAAIVERLLAENPLVEIVCAPGNAGIADKIHCVLSPKVEEVDRLVMLATLGKFELIIVGPEAPLILGVANRFRQERLHVCGPSFAAAFSTEESKAHFKMVLEKYGIPTAGFRIFHEYEKACLDVKFFGPENVVIKPDGLTGGKGVVLPETMKEAKHVLSALMHDGAYNGAGRSVIIEDRLHGPECSATAITDGCIVHMLPFAQDYKRAYDGGAGPNTGGMGARTIELTPEEKAEAAGIMQKVVDALASKGYPYRGFLYLGLMKTDGGFKVLEANCRLGDPEAQVVLTSMAGDFTELCMAAAMGDLSQVEPPKQVGHSVCIVMASPEYPEPSSRDYRIVGINDAETAGASVFHAGTARRYLPKTSPYYSTNKSGRVLSVVGRGDTIEAARAIAYEGVRRIATEPVGALRYRTDIGKGSWMEHKG